MLQKMLILVALIFSFSTFAAAACPNGTYAIPPCLGIKHDCVALVTTSQDIVLAQYHCKYDYGGSLISIPNEHANTFLASKELDLIFLTEFL